MHLFLSISALCLKLKNTVFFFVRSFFKERNYRFGVSLCTGKTAQWPKHFALTLTDNVTIENGYHSSLGMTVGLHVQ